MYGGRPRRPLLPEMTTDPRINMRSINLFPFAATGTRARAASN
jgi:hypothetical protein